MSDAQLARLIVSLEAKMDAYDKSLDKALAKAQGTSGQIKKHLDDVDDRFTQLFGKSDPGKAIDNIFSRARFNIIDEGGKRLSIFGSAIEALGPLGIAAAGGVAALALTLERASKAVEFGAEIAKLGRTIGVSTDFIQEFNFAARQSDVDVTGADEALKKLNESLGLVQSGLARKQLTNAFAALGFTPEQLKQYHDVGELFPVLADRMAAMGNAAEQAAIAKRLGMSELLPLIQQLGGGFSKTAQEARGLGIVMSGALVQQSEEAKKKLSEIDDVMKSKANITFAEFATTIISVKTAFMEAEKAGLSFLANMTGTQSAKQKLDLINTQIAAVYGRHRDGSKLEPAEQSLINALVARSVALQGDFLKEGAADAAGGKGPPQQAAATLYTPPGKAKTDRTAQALDESLKIEAQAHATILQALLAQATDLAEQMALERQITQADRDKINAEFDEKAAKLAAAKDIQGAQKKIIGANDEKARQEELQALDLKETTKLLDQQLAHEKVRIEQLVKLDDIEASILSSRAGMATTLKERAALELAALQKRQEAERLGLQNTLYDALQRGDSAAASRAFSTYAATLGRQSQDTAALNQQNAGPVQQYLRSVQDLDTEFQNEGVTAVRSLASGLADAAVNAKSFGDVLSNVIRQLLAQAAAAALEKEGAQLLAMIPGFADGTNSAPGGLALVGERGPELVNLPRGSQVLNNASTANAVRGSGSTVVYADFTGAVVTEELFGQFKAYADAVSSRAAMGAVVTAKSETLKSLRASTAGALGRR